MIGFDQGMATLVYSDADGVDRSFALGSEPVMVGRAAECAIRSDDPRVSRMHARFFVDQGVLWVEDLGSSNGIFVGPNKVQRAPVPTSEIILVGSLMIRLLPASGTLPPPMGLHGTLASWLDLERKARAAVEEERDAFARRVGELHEQIAAGVPTTTLRDGSGPVLSFGPSDTQPGMAAEAFRLRDEADAKVAALESALAAMQDEMTVLRKAVGGASDDGADLIRLRDELAAARARVATLEQDVAERSEWSSNIDVESSKMIREVARLQGVIDEAEAARSIAEHAAGEASRESQSLREELVQIRRASQTELEATRLDLAKTREAKMMAETAAGIAVAEKLAEADLVVMTLQRELATARAAAVTPDARVRELGDLNAAASGRLEKAEKDLAAAQIRAQGAERNLSHANAQAAKAEAQAAQLAQKVADADLRTKTTEDDLGKARERIAALETRLGAGDAPVQAAEARAAKLAIELAELAGQFETRRDRLVELEKAVADAQALAAAAETKVAATRTELDVAAGKLAEADRRAVALQARLDQLGKAELEIANAIKARDEATARALAGEKRVTDSERRTEDAEKRASAADTMAKAMAKDVAEALRRAADADTRARSVSRELENAHKRANNAEAVSAEVAAAVGDSQRRVAEAEARVATIEQELGGKLEATQRELGGKLEATQAALGGKLEAVQRELAAERSTSLTMVDRKTQLERELADIRGQLPLLVARAEAAEKKAVEGEVQIETLQDRVLDLESGMAVSETAQQASLAEAREEIKSLKMALAEAKVAAAKLERAGEQLRARVGELEKQLAETTAARTAAEEALREASSQIAELRRAADSQQGSEATAQERLEDALSRAGEAERKIDALAARAEAADLAIGRAGALQRQLDEAILKLAWLEREAQNKQREASRGVEQSEAIVSDRVASAENRTKEADTRTRDAESRLEQTERRLQAATASNEELAGRITELERRVQQAESSSRAGSDAERRARDAEARLAEADGRVQVAERTSATLQHQLVDSQNRVGALEREVATADNVRSFAAETEREIAQLQREIREGRAKLTQMTLERDRLVSELQDLRGDDGDTTNRRVPAIGRTPTPSRRPEAAYDPDATAALDVGRIEAMIAKTTELEKKVTVLERDNASLRKQLGETEQRLRDAIDGSDDDEAESTRTGSQLPIVLAEHVSALEESIDSLRANMRAASDETAIMEQSDSVIAVSSAVSQAAEHIERARASVRALAATIGLNS